MRRLIVNADDFGLTSGVNRAIVELHRGRVLSSATLMAHAAATEKAVQQALNTPSLGVGCHLVLVDGTPVLPAHQLPTLTDRSTGRFEPTLGAFLRRLLSGAIRAAEIEAEAAAQIALLQRRGLALTHIDTHKHTHMFPAVLQPVLRAARAAAIGAVRNPFEPPWSRRATPQASFVRRVEVKLLGRLQPAFQRIVRENNFRAPDGALGVLATGTLDAAGIRSVLAALPPGAWELVTHPGYNDQDLQRARTRLTASRETERRALLSALRFEGVELIDFAQL